MLMNNTNIVDVPSTIYKWVVSIVNWQCEKACLPIIKQCISVDAARLQVGLAKIDSQHEGNGGLK